MTEQDLDAHRRFKSLTSQGIKPAIVLTRKARLKCALYNLFTTVEYVRDYTCILWLAFSSCGQRKASDKKMPQLQTTEQSLLPRV